MPTYSFDKKPLQYTLEELQSILSDIALGLTYNGKALEQVLGLDCITSGDKVVIQSYIKGNQHLVNMAHIKLQSIANKVC